MTDERTRAITQEIINRVGFQTFREQGKGKSAEELADWLAELKRPEQEADKLTFVHGRHITTDMLRS